MDGNVQQKEEEAREADERCLFLFFFPANAGGIHSHYPPQPQLLSSLVPSSNISNLKAHRTATEELLVTKTKQNKKTGHLPWFLTTLVRFFLLGTRY